ncbi:MAG: hypothetical protein HY866_21820 [Chloroflexi bacterium]|nr:hypothetical protein [Chloroflexota bacterium]
MKHKTLLGLIVIAAIFLISLPPQAVTRALPASSGKIAISGADGNIHLYDVDSKVLTPLTSDAVPGRKIYNWPTWSTDGHLAYFGVDLDHNPPYQLGIFVQPPGGAPEQVYTADDESFTYAYWSPADCPVGKCRDLAVLYTASGGDLAVRRVRSLNGGTDFSVDDIGAGSPFYWDWSPDGQAMIWARFGYQLELYDVASAEIVQTYSEQLGTQRAVDWSPIDNRLLAAVAADNRTSDLTVFDGDQRQILAAGLDGIISFEWSPDGSYVAYADDDLGNLYIVDSHTGVQTAAVAGSVVGFFWSPDSSKIAYITITREETNDNTAAKPSAQQGELVIRWNVYNADTKSNNRLAEFLPTQSMIYYLQFYDQFARSHRLWSPDSRYIVYAESTRERYSIVSLQDTRDPGAAPQTIMEGNFGVFSW